mgnify:CR=1 FL=1
MAEPHTTIKSDHLTKIGLYDLIEDLTAAALAALEVGEVDFGPRKHTAARNLQKVRTGLMASGRGDRVLALEFFRRAHETWALYQQLTKAEGQADYWEIWCEWSLLINGPHSELRVLALDPLYETVFSRLPHTQQEWLDLDEGPRRPLDHAQLDAALQALSDLERIMSVESDRLEHEAREEVSQINEGMPDFDLEGRLARIS